MSERLKLMCDYHCSPLWEYGGGDLVGNPDPNDLPLSDELKSALHAWAASFDRTLNDDYPPDSGFASPEDEDAFEAEGLRLWQELQTRLGAAYEVVYYSGRLGQILDKLPSKSEGQVPTPGSVPSGSARVETA